MPYKRRKLYSIWVCIVQFKSLIQYFSRYDRQIWNLESQKRCCKQYYINSISSLNSHYLTIYALTLTRILARRLDVSVLLRSRKISCLPWIYILEHNNLWFVLFIKNWKKIIRTNLFSCYCIIKDLSLYNYQKELLFEKKNTCFDWKTTNHVMITAVSYHNYVSHKTINKLTKTSRLIISVLLCCCAFYLFTGSIPLLILHLKLILLLWTWSTLISPLIQH